jgi:hypothetical protein
MTQKKLVRDLIALWHRSITEFAEKCGVKLMSEDVEVGFLHSVLISRSNFQSEENRLFFSVYNAFTEY